MVPKSSKVFNDRNNLSNVLSDDPVQNRTIFLRILNELKNNRVHAFKSNLQYVSNGYRSDVRLKTQKQ